VPQKSGAAGVTARERERQALALRKGGATYEEIARTLGVAQGTAYKAVQRVFARLARESQEDAEQLRQLELVRLDAILVQMTRVLDGKESTPRQRCDTADRLIKVGERRARLLNLDALPPPQPPLVVPGGASASEFLNGLVKRATPEQLVVLQSLLEQAPPPPRDDFYALLDACRTTEEVDQLWELRRRSRGDAPGPAVTPAAPPG
jgi:DNA-binding CsgD family transcriptional regulator